VYSGGGGDPRCSWKLDPNPDLHQCEKLNACPDPDSHFKLNFRGLKWGRGVLGKLTLETWRLEMEPLRFCIPVVVDMHHFDEEQDPDPHKSGKLDQALK
jgi:hypothetical protein